MLNLAHGFTDSMALLRRLGEIVKCVCHITVPTAAGTVAGTGLLVGDETVLTNYHVVESLIKRAPGADRAGARLLFDFHTGPDGQTVSSGVSYELVDDDEKWLIASRPYHADDLTARPIPQNVAGTRPSDDLDFALLRVAGKPGAQRLGSKPTTTGDQRGHIKLPADADARFAADFEKGKAAVFIFQHPSGKALKFDWEKPRCWG